MIAFLQGSVFKARQESLLVNVNGTGYEVFVCSPHRFVPGQDVFLYTYHQIREDDQVLYGFENEADYDVFIRLIEVRGIGCKSAMNLLKHCDGARMVEAIENQDVAMLKKLPGIGPKTASQIVLDLKGKLVPVNKTGSQSDLPAGTAAWQDVAQALESLGYTPAQIAKAAKSLASLEEEVPVLLKKALALVSGY